MRFGSKSDIFSSGSRPLSGLGLKIDSLEALACDILSFDPETVMLDRRHVMLGPKVETRTYGFT